MSFLVVATCSSLRGATPTGVTSKSMQEDATVESESESLSPIVITAPAYRQVRTPVEEFLAVMYLKFGPFNLPLFKGSYVFTPERLPQFVRNSPARVAIFPANLTDQPPIHAAVDQILSSTVLLNPRMTLSPATRERVGLVPRVKSDGIPADDPFDHSIRWSEWPNAALARLEFVPTGGATAWGDASAGLLQLFTTPAAGKLVLKSAPPAKVDPAYEQPAREIVSSTGLLEASAGSFGFRQIELTHTEPTRVGMFQVLARADDTDGFVAPYAFQQGTIDQPQRSRHRWLEARSRHVLGSSVEITGTVKLYEDSRGLGTPDQSEDVRAQLSAVQFTSRSTEGFVSNAIIYGQRRERSQTVSTVTRNRNAETPLFATTAEPVVSLGASWTGEWHSWGDVRTNIGVEVQTTRGEVRGDFRYLNGAFSRAVDAGGEQTSAGVFAIHNRKLSRELHGMAGVRLDRWSESNGHLRERDLGSHAVLRDERGPDDSGIEFSPSVGLTWDPSKKWLFRAVGQQSFQPPTLAERFRWSGENNRLIAPNPELRSQRAASAEVSAEFAATKTWSIALRGFFTRFRDFTATQAVAGGSNELLLIPDNTTIEQRTRINLDRVHARGVELSTAWRDETFSAEAGVRLSDTAIDRATQTPLLIGHQLPGTPRLVSFADATWRPIPKLRLHAHVRWLGREFFDEENTRRLGEAVMIGALVAYGVRPPIEVFLQAENLTDVLVEVARGGDGVHYRASPRTFSGGVRVTW